MKESLDQTRARFAWDKVTRWANEHPRDDSYEKLAKGAPALIMQSGLMPVLAFLKDKDKDHHKALLAHICEWLHQQFKGRIARPDFSIVMAALMGDAKGDAAEHARLYQHATQEVMALLRWIRQFAAAVGEGEGSRNA